MQDKARHDTGCDKTQYRVRTRCDTTQDQDRIRCDRTATRCRMRKDNVLSLWVIAFDFAATCAADLDERQQNLWRALLTRDLRTAYRHERREIGPPTEPSAMRVRFATDAFLVAAYARSVPDIAYHGRRAIAPYAMSVPDIA
eukprot:2098352-Rhodomonas_salina.1